MSTFDGTFCPSGRDASDRPMYQAGSQTLTFNRDGGRWCVGTDCSEVTDMAPWRLRNLLKPKFVAGKIGTFHICDPGRTVYTCTLFTPVQRCYQFCFFFQCWFTLIGTQRWMDDDRIIGIANFQPTSSVFFLLSAWKTYNFLKPLGFDWFLLVYFFSLLKATPLGLMTSNWEVVNVSDFNGAFEGQMPKEKNSESGKHPWQFDQT